MEVSQSIADKTTVSLLKNLYEIGMKFDSLIYNLPENTGYKEFYSKCKLVLDRLKQHSYLTNYMVNFIAFSVIQ